jgi:hypothetical protein
MMYSTAMNFHSNGATIEPCESDFVAVVAGRVGISESPLQIVIGETKTEGQIDSSDVRKLGKLADAVPGELAETYILLSKTGTFTGAEIAEAKKLNQTHRLRVVLWSREELEPFYPYARAEEKLGSRSYAGSLTDLANITQRLYFS